MRTVDALRSHDCYWNALSLVDKLKVMESPGDPDDWGSVKRLIERAGVEINRIEEGEKK